MSIYTQANDKAAKRPNGRSLQRFSSMHSTNRSGVTGVYWEPDRLKWRAKIVDHGRVIYLGRYASFLDAVSARQDAERLLKFPQWHGQARRFNSSDLQGGAA